MSFIPESYNPKLPTVLCSDGNLLQRGIAIYTLPTLEWEVVAYKTSDRVIVRNLDTLKIQMCKVVYNLSTSIWSPTTEFGISKSSGVFSDETNFQRAEIVYDLNDPVEIWIPTLEYTDSKSSSIFTDETNFQRAEFVYNISTWDNTETFNTQKSSSIFTDETNFQRAEFVYKLN